MGLDKVGKGPGRFLSYGVYQREDGGTCFKAGYFDGTFHPFDQDRIEEDIRYSYFKGYEGGRHPSVGLTEPVAEKNEAYSWAKSPRYNGLAVEVGPLARMINDRDPLILDLVKNSGLNVYTRTFNRIHEVIKLIGMIRDWLREVDPTEPFLYKGGDQMGKGADLLRPQGVLLGIG